LGAEGAVDHPIAAACATSSKPALGEARLIDEWLGRERCFESS
jgi:hypothetical protein